MENFKIWFSMVKLAYSIKNNLLDKFKNVENIWYHSTDDKHNEYMNENMKTLLRKAWDKEKIEFIKEKLVSDNIDIVTKTDDLYPKRLKVYDDSPYALFYKGNISKINDKCNVSIIGSRECTSYGINITNVLCENLLENNINIISGMARGIDSVAHKKCIEKGKYTCAVLGSGIDVIYPKENFKLYNGIIKNGCVISEFLPGTKPYYYNFPRRNKIISALSDLVVVVEAGEKSGSLITAGAALEQGKDVIAVPGSVFSSKSKGTNKLIKDGAYVLTSVNDVFDLLGIDNYCNNVKNKNILNNFEKNIYAIINNTPMHFDEILRLTNIDIKQLYEVLFELQLKNEIMCLSGNYYVRNNKII